MHTMLDIRVISTTRNVKNYPRSLCKSLTNVCSTELVYRNIVLRFKNSAPSGTPGLVAATNDFKQAVACTDKASWLYFNVAAHLQIDE